MNLKVTLMLLSDATFGRGDGVAGFVDTEVEQEDETGLPCIKGRTLRGLIVEECANLLEAIRLQHDGTIPEPLRSAAQKLFGAPGSADADAGALHIGPALFPSDLRAVVRQARLQPDGLSQEDVLTMTTCIRRQTAMDEETDAPLPNSLRAQRAVIRNTRLEAELRLASEPEGLELPLLAAAVRGVRRGGSARNRGRGALEARLCDAEGREIAPDPLFRHLAGLDEGAHTDQEVSQ